MSRTTRTIHVPDSAAISTARSTPDATPNHRHHQSRPLSFLTPWRVQVTGGAGPCRPGPPAVDLRPACLPPSERNDHIDLQLPAPTAAASHAAPAFSPSVRSLGRAWKLLHGGGRDARIKCISHSMHARQGAARRCGGESLCAVAADAPASTNEYVSKVAAAFVSGFLTSKSLPGSVAETIGIRKIRTLVRWRRQTLKSSKAGLGRGGRSVQRANSVAPGSGLAARGRESERHAVAECFEDVPSARMLYCAVQ
jgi:hypothetical protein